jgi:hypothetical protein
MQKLILYSLALYEADQKAHEEAVKNGGVRDIRDYIVTHLLTSYSF